MKEAEVVWMLAQMQPATIAELHHQAPDFVTACDKKSVGTATRNCWRKALLVRRKRTESERQPQPYEYALAEFDPDA